MTFKSTICTIILAVVNMLVLLAAPAIPTPVKMTQPDGSQLLVRINGDESFGYYTTMDGYLLTKDKDGYFSYAAEKDDNLVPTVRANNIEMRSVKETEILQSIKKDAVLESYRTANRNNLKTAINHLTTKFPNTGSPRTLVILVEFQDVKFSRPHEEIYSIFNDMLNKEGYSFNGATGSTLDYFSDASSEKFTPQFDLYGPVELSKNVAYYGENTSTPGTDIRAKDMVTEACRLLDSEIDFNDYDLDGNGVVDNVFIFFAGYSESQGGQDYTIWPHKSTIAQSGLFDGLRLNTYACAGELNGNEGTEITGIGTFTHEFCHVMGLQDLYSTNDSDAYHPGPWSILATGIYNNESRTPPTFSAYEKYAMGWIEPEELTVAANVELNPIATNEAFLISTSSKNEFYILENRQLEGWDAYLPGHGMLIWHIDYSELHWLGNVVNNVPDHQRVDIEEANGVAEDRSGDPFPGTAHKTMFADFTDPSMITWSGSKLNKPVTNIREIDGKIYFKFKGGIVLDDKVTLKEATEISYDSFTANWEVKEGAENYYLDVYQKNGSEIIYVEGAADIPVGNATSYTVTDLQPEKDYYYVVRAILAEGETTDSDEMKVTTDLTPFHWKTPIALNATQISYDSFSANWRQFDGAVSYLITLKEVITTIKTDNHDFTGELPEGWNTSGEKTFEEGFYGESAPGLKFSASQDYIRTNQYSKPITKFSFWYNGTADREKPSVVLVVMAHVIGDSEYTRIADIQPLNVSGGKTYELDAGIADYDMVYLGLLTDWKETVSIDDIMVEYGREVTEEEVEPYIDYNAGNGTSFNLTGLKPETEYAYTITAFNGDVKSRESNQVKIKTSKAPVGVDSEYEESIDYNIIDNIIYINKENVPVQVFNMQGQMIVNTHSSSSGIKLSSGIYILKIGQKSYKVIL